MLDDIVSPRQRRGRESLEKFTFVDDILAKYGPLTRDELEEKLNQNTWDFERLWNNLAPYNGFNKVTLSIRNIPEVFGQLKNKAVIYKSFQEIELGMRIGHNIACSLTYPKLNATKRNVLTRELSRKIPERVLMIVKLHYPGVIDHFIDQKGDPPEKQCKFGNADQYWQAMSKVKFANYHGLTNEGIRIATGVRINLDQGYDSFLNYQRNFPPEDVNWYRWHTQKFAKFLLGRQT